MENDHPDDSGHRQRNIQLYIQVEKTETKSSWENFIKKTERKKYLINGCTNVGHPPTPSPSRNVLEIISWQQWAGWVTIQRAPRDRLKGRPHRERLWRHLSIGHERRISRLSLKKRTERFDDASYLSTLVAQIPNIMKHEL